MKTLKFLPSFLAVAALSLPGAALAASVDVTFKNLNTSQPADYSISNSAQSVTYANANPKPAPQVPPGGINVYTVSQITSLVTIAEVQYTMGSKKCVFHTDFTATPSGSTVIPNWTKKATSSGGATCTANITSVNPSTYDWTVEFTMK